MSTVKSWILAARLRTLPLSISGILVGAGMANRDGYFNGYIFGLALLTTIGFQVLSNFANDYGDGIKGTDNEDRVGPARAMQQGLLSARELKMGMIITAALTLCSSIALIYKAFGLDKLFLSILFLALGLAAIIAAVKYTVGKSAYGYRGLGDLFVFIFFGLVGVAGSYFLFTQKLQWFHFLPAISIGLFSTVVLHLNNMRDRISDEKSGKNTMAVILGKSGAVRYHNFILGTGILSWILYLVITNAPGTLFISCIAFLPLAFHFRVVRLSKDHRLLDPELKKVALATFFLALLFFVSSIYIYS